MPRGRDHHVEAVAGLDARTEIFRETLPSPLGDITVHGVGAADVRRKTPESQYVVIQHALVRSWVGQIRLPLGI